MAHHNTKLFVDFFADVKSKLMTGMVRFNDRNYRAGDTITFHAGYPDIEAESGFHYTGDKISARISYVSSFGCEKGYVCLSLCDIGIWIVGDENSPE